MSIFNRNNLYLWYIWQLEIAKYRKNRTWRRHYRGKQSLGICPDSTAICLFGLPCKRRMQFIRCQSEGNWNTRQFGWIWGRREGHYYRGFVDRAESGIVCIRHSFVYYNCRIGIGTKTCRFGNTGSLDNYIDSRLILWNIVFFQGEIEK